MTTSERTPISAEGFCRPEDFDRPPNEAQVIWAMTWLSSAPRTKKVNRHLTSYGLKHICEKLNPSRVGGGYCSNGSLLMAARNLGITMEPCCEGSLNGFLTIDGGWVGDQQRLVWLLDRRTA
jgi:hypothetical protein